MWNHLRVAGERNVPRMTLTTIWMRKTVLSRIKNKDDLCLARALAVAKANVDKDPRYKQIKRSDRPLQREKAFDLHEAANVPLGPCGLNEVALFQQYLTHYQIMVISGDHNNSIIYPPQSSGTDEKPHLALYLHAIISIPLTVFQGSWDGVIFVSGVIKRMIILPITYAQTCVDRVEVLDAL